MTARTAETRLLGKKAGPVAAQTSQSWPADFVERRPVASLVPYARNARTHSPEQVAQVAASIREWGWTVPVLVDEASNIVAGHCRVLAAHRLGLTEVPVMVARGWSEAQKQAYVIADNKLALNAGWDENLLRIELGELRGLGADLGLTGFGELEIGALLGFTSSNADPDEAPEVPARAVSHPGDLWICGEHRVLCGDAVVSADLETVLAAEPADMCFTDPPYNVAYGDSTKDTQLGKHRPILNDSLDKGFEGF